MDLIDKRIITDQLDRIEEMLKEAWEKIEAYPVIQEEDRSGKWENVGHRIGFINHPDSVWYRCSVCGHEQYTLYGFNLPSVCPICKAKMECDDAEVMDLTGIYDLKKMTKEF